MFKPLLPVHSLTKKETTLKIFNINPVKRAYNANLSEIRTINQILYDDN
jgi:hypothetical protein